VLADLVLVTVVLAVGGHQPVPLDPYLGRLLRQLFFQFVQLGTTSGDPLQASRHPS
jgi:hypothetical protein